MRNAALRRAWAWLAGSPGALQGVLLTTTMRRVRGAGGGFMPLGYANSGPVSEDISKPHNKGQDRPYMPNRTYSFCEWIASPTKSSFMSETSLYCTASTGNQIERRLQ
jgi:hypothetical protein